MSLLRFDGVACLRGRRLLFESIGFTLGPGDALVVSGPNGAGKSSLLRIAAGLLREAAGRVERGGRIALADENLALDARLSLRKKSFPNTLRTFKPVNETSKLTVKLAKTLFSVKVTSTPAGATITAGGKSMGVTPTTIKLPGFEGTPLTLTKPGFAPDTQRVNPKQNNASHHVTLKKGKAR